MKAYVNENCIGCGLCVGLCPEVFEMTDEDVAQVIAEVSEEMESQVVEAQESCPVSAIEVSADRE